MKLAGKNGGEARERRQGSGVGLLKKMYCTFFQEEFADRLCNRAGVS